MKNKLFCIWSLLLLPLLCLPASGQGRRIQDLPEVTSDLIDAESNLLFGTSKLDSTSAPAQSYKLSLSELLELLVQVKNVKRYGAVGDGVTDDRAAILAAANAVAATGGKIYFPPTANSYLVNTSLDIPSNVRVKVDRGALIKVTSGQVLNLQGGVEAGEYQIFDADVGGIKIQHEVGTATTTYPYLSIYQEQDTVPNPRLRVSHHQDRLCALWFKGDDIGRKINAGLWAGGTGTTIYIPPGFYVLSETVNMAENKNGNNGPGDNLTVEGVGDFIGTNIQIANGAQIIAFDMYAADESTVRNIRITEMPGAPKTGIGIRLGGTTCHVRDVWLGNSDIGLLLTGAAGCEASNIAVEHCRIGMAVYSQYQDESYSVLGNITSNVRHCRFSNVQLYNNDLYGAHVERFEIVEVESVSGTFAVGETVDITPGGQTAEVFKWNPTYGNIVLRFPIGAAGNRVVDAGDTISNTGGSGASCTATNNGISGQSRGLAWTNCLFHENGTGANGGKGFYCRGRIQDMSVNASIQHAEDGGVGGAGFNISDANGFTLSSIQCEGAANNPVHVDVTGGWGTIAGCNFRGGGTTVTGIKLTNANITITGNTFDDFTTPLDVTGGGNTYRSWGNVGIASNVVGAADSMGFLGRSKITSAVDGNINLQNNAGTDFGLLRLGGSTSSFPAIKRSGTAAQIRLADDSANAPLQASQLTVDAAGSLAFSGRSKITSAVDGNINLQNNAGTGFGLLRLGGTTTGFPAFKPTTAGSTGVLQVRLADDSDYATVQCENIRFRANTYLVSEAAQQLALRSGTNAQTFRVYNTYTSASVYERGFARWVSNVFEVGTTQTGATNRSMALVPATGIVGIGGATVSDPALKKSSTELQVRLGDDSAFAPIQGSQVTYPELASAPTGVADKAIVFAEDNGSGKTRLMVQFPTGSAVQIAIEP